MSNGFVERRSHERYYEQTVLYWKKNEKRFDGMLNNISNGGLGFSSEGVLKIGDEVQIKLILFHHTESGLIMRSLNVPVFIRWFKAHKNKITKYEYGGEFKELDKKTEREMDDFLHHLGKVG